MEKASIDEAYVDLTDRVLELVRSRQIVRIDPASDLSDSFVVGSFTSMFTMFTTHFASFDAC